MTTEDKTPVNNSSEALSFSRTPQYASSPDSDKLKFVLEQVTQKSDPIKLFATLQTSGKKVMDEIEDISKQIYQAKRPFLPYYHPQTETIKSKKEITLEMQNHFDFFKSSPVIRRTPKLQNQNENEDMVEKRAASSTPKGFKISKVSTPSERKKNFFKVFEDKGPIDPEKLQEMALNMRATPSGNYELRGSEPRIGAGSRNMFYPHENEKLPVDLNQDALKRKKLIQELRKGRDNKSSGGQGFFTNMEEIAGGAAKRENTPESIYSTQRNRLLKKMDLSTKSPYANAYYQILAMPVGPRHSIVNKLNISPVSDATYSKRKY